MLLRLVLPDWLFFCFLLLHFVQEFLLTSSRSLGPFFGIAVGLSRSGLLCLKSGSSCLALLVGWESTKSSKFYLFQVFLHSAVNRLST